MAKGKAKFSSESVAAPQPRSLRSRKRECPSDELSVDAEAPLHQQDSKGNNSAVVRIHIQSLKFPLQECATITNQLLQAAEQSCLSKHDASTEEKQAENQMKASEELEENSATCPNHDSQLQGCIINLENDANKDGKKEIEPQKVTVLVSDTCTDQQVLTSEDGDGFCVDALEKQLGAKKKPYCNLENRHESSQEELSHVCMDDSRDVAKESALGLPIRKKRRMGMCGLTEKERSHFLQTQKRENGHNEVERAEKQLWNNGVDPVAQEDVITPAPSVSSPLSNPVDCATVQSKAEIKLQSSHCGEDTRTETDVAMLDGTGALGQSGCSEGNTSEAEESTATEQKSNQPAEKTVGSPSVSLKQQEQDEAIPVKQREDGEDDSACLDRVPFTNDYTETSRNEGTEKKNNGSETDTLLVGVTGMRDEMMEDNGVEAGAATTDSVGFNCVEQCALHVELAAGSSTVNTEHNETGDTMEPFGSQHFDYVSDSQLNSIALIEEKIMGKEEDAGFLSRPKDATNLVCGLIRELSSLNLLVSPALDELLTSATIGHFLCALIGSSLVVRLFGTLRGPPQGHLVSRKVMAAHREVENLRRGHSRSSTR